MRKFASIVVLSLAMSSLALAQSSGSFSASIANTACTLNTSTGQIGNGLPGGTVISTTVQTPNSSSTALDIRFSAVTGLFTDTKVSNTVSTSTAVAGITVFATIDGQPIAPNKTCSAGAGCYNVDGVLQTGVVYDERFQQISQNFLSLLAGLIACTTTPTGACDFDLVQSTLSAHSMDFVAPNVGQGSHNLKVSWAVTNVTSGSNANAAACIGPATLTVTQVKAFSQSGGITF